MRPWLVALTMAACLSWTAAYARKELKYPVSKVPLHLMENSDLVLRHEAIRFGVKNDKRAIQSVHFVVTLLNEKARNVAECAVPYDENTKVQYLEATIYDREGHEVKKLYVRDFEDMSRVNSVSVLDDNRIKYAYLSHIQYPYTIEVQYELHHNGLLHYPTWHPQYRYRQSVVNSTFEVVVPEGEHLRYKEYNVPARAEVIEEGGARTYRWESGALQPVHREPFMPSLASLVPVVRTAPHDFRFEKYSGQMDSWDHVADFVMQLNEGRQQLPEATVDRARALVRDAPDDLEKIKRLYRYVQNNTRYISVQLGIGGWQPWSADFVAEHGYGDCKALTNYAMSLLQAVGIPSVYTLVRAGKDEMNIDRSFPSLQFNHVILCVPNHGDTVWLECTSPDAPFGYSGRFTGDRDVLLCTESGGKVVRTPAYTANQNRLDQLCTVSIDRDGHAMAEYRATFQGLQYEQLYGISDLGSDQQKKRIYDLIDIPHFEIADHTIVEEKDRLPAAHLEVALELPRYAAASGKRIFFQPNLLNRRTALHASEKARQCDLVLDYAYTDVDSISYSLPEDYHFEYVPEAIDIESPFGSYSAQFVIDQGRMLYVRTVTMKEGVFPPESYHEFVEFYNNISKADQIKVVLVRST